MEELISNTKIAVWIIGVLLTIISTLSGFVIWYVLDLIKEAKSLGGKISKNTYSILGLKETQNSNLSALHSSEKSLWDELIKLRRAVVSGTMVIQRRRAETFKILDEQRCFSGKLEKHQKILSGHHHLLKKQIAENGLTQSKVHILSEKLYLLKTEKKKD